MLGALGSHTSHWLIPLPFTFVPIQLDILCAGHALSLHSAHPSFPRRSAPHLFDGCHAHGLIVVQGCIGCAHVVAKACNCHLITAVECHGHCHTAKSWDVLEEKEEVQRSAGGLCEAEMSG